MTPRENLLSLYRRQGYETVPVEFSLCPTLVDTFRSKYGPTADPREVFGFAHRHVPGLPRVEANVDWRAYYPDGLAEGAQIDSTWGVAREPGSAEAFHMKRMRHPLAGADSLEQIQAYPWPQFDPAGVTDMATRAQEIRDADLAALGSMACTIWETAWYVRSMEQLMMDMATDDPKAHAVLDAVTDRAVMRAEGFARAGADLLHLGDDVGTQRGLMMSKPMWRDWLRPRLARVIGAAKHAKPDLLVSYHSCGNVTELVGEFIEIGVDILNPVQPECMDFAALHAEYGDRLSFNGTIGTQTTMPFGTPAEVRETVGRNLDIAGSAGGLLPCPTHLLEPEVPWENVEAYVSACREYY